MSNIADLARPPEPAASKGLRSQGAIGVAVLSNYMAELAPELVCIEAGDELLRREFWMVVHTDVRRSPGVRAVMDTIVEILERDRRPIEGPVQKRA